MADNNGQIGLTLWESVRKYFSRTSPTTPAIHKGPRDPNE